MPVVIWGSAAFEIPADPGGTWYLQQGPRIVLLTSHAGFSRQVPDLCDTDALSAVVYKESAVLNLGNLLLSGR